MPTYRHGDTGFPAVNAALGANFARGGGLLGALGLGKDREKEAQMRQIAAELELQRMRGEQQIGATRAAGGEQRITAELAHKLGLSAEQAKAINQLNQIRTEGDEGRKTVRATANAGTMAKNNLLDTDENQAVFTGATADPTIANVRGGEMTKGRVREFGDRIRATPEGMDAMTSNLLSGLYEPAFANVAKGTVAAGPGQAIAIPERGDAMPPTKPSQFNMLQGATTATELTPGTYNQMTGMNNPDKITSSQTPGGLVPKIPIMQPPAPGVMAAPPGGIGAATTPAIQEDPNALLQRIIQTMIMKQQQQTGPGQPVVPRSMPMGY